MVSSISVNPVSSSKFLAKPSYIFSPPLCLPLSYPTFTDSDQFDSLRAAQATEKDYEALPHIAAYLFQIMN